MSWSFLKANEALESRRTAWDELNRARFDHVLLDSSFVSAAVKNFGDQNTMLGIFESEISPAMLLFEKRGWGFWQTFQPSQAPLGPVLFGAQDVAWNQARSLLRSVSPIALGFGVTQQDPEFTSFPRAGQESDLEFVDYIDTPRLLVEGKFEDYWKSRSKNLKHNLKRQRKRFAEQAVKLRLVTSRKADGVADLVRDYGELEQRGWKGGRGTAVTADNRQGAFYRDVLEAACARNEGVIYKLMIGETTAACDLCLERNGTLVILKTAYDSSIKGCSPGLLLHEEILKTLFTEGRVARVEFYGRMLEWHSKFTDQVRRMYHVNVHRNGWMLDVRRSLKKILSGQPRA